MTRPDPERLLELVEGELTDEERARLLAELEADPALAAEMAEVAAGLDALRAMADGQPSADPTPPKTGNAPGRGVSAWWILVAAVATLATTVPLTLVVGRGAGADATGVVDEAGPDQFVLVLRGQWQDGGSVPPDEARRRIDEYWDWTSALADQGVLVATSDLALEGIDGSSRANGADRSPGGDTGDYLVGMFTVSMDSYQEALAVARSSPHLLYGGSITVQRVSGGFVTVSGARDWTS